jgi:hypothetical protein
MVNPTAARTYWSPVRLQQEIGHIGAGDAGAATFSFGESAGVTPWAIGQGQRSISIVSLAMMICSWTFFSSIAWRRKPPLTSPPGLQLIG